MFTINENRLTGYSVSKIVSLTSVWSLVAESKCYILLSMFGFNSFHSQFNVAGAFELRECRDVTCRLRDTTKDQKSRAEPFWTHRIIDFLGRHLQYIDVASGSG